MYRSKRNIRIEGKVYDRGELYPSIPSIFKHEFEKVDVEDVEIEVVEKPKRKRAKKK